MRRNLLAMAALMSMVGTVGMVGEEPSATDAPIKRRRNYDLEGPEPQFGPPTARYAQFPMTRQQRRWQERQSKKKEGGQ